MNLKAAGIALITCTFAHAQNPLMQAYMPRYNAMKQNLIESAEAMPAEHYSFKLTPEQRTFADWLDHTVMLLHGSCAAMKGEATPPMDHSKHAAGVPKPQLQKALREAADYCDSVLKDMTDAQALATITVNGKSATPVNSMIGLLTNMASHYGNMVGYMRSKGVVPPSTARSQRK
jgi:uncharacterized damage-inducible protein DinB